MMLILERIYRKLRVIIKTIFFKLMYTDKLKMNKYITFRKNFNLKIDKTGFCEIGEGCFFNNDCSINVMGTVKIGNNCICGEGVKIYDHNHIFNKKNQLIKEQGMRIGSITIGNNCWIGSNVTILKDVNIGNNVVIGANCLIDRDITSNKIVKLSNDNITINEIIYKDEEF